MDAGDLPKRQQITIYERIVRQVCLFTKVKWISPCSTNLVLQNAALETNSRLPDQATPPSMERRFIAVLVT